MVVRYKFCEAKFLAFVLLLCRDCKSLTSLIDTNVLLVFRLNQLQEFFLDVVHVSNLEKCLDVFFSGFVELQCGLVRQRPVWIVSAF